MGAPPGTVKSGELAIGQNDRLPNQTITKEMTRILGGFYVQWAWTKFSRYFMYISFITDLIFTISVWIDSSVCPYVWLASKNQVWPRDVCSNTLFNSHRNSNKELDSRCGACANTVSPFDSNVRNNRERINNSCGSRSWKRLEEGISNFFPTLHAFLAFLSTVCNSAITDHNSCKAQWCPSTQTFF